MNKEAMYKLSYGLFVLTAKEGKKDNGNGCSLSFVALARRFGISSGDRGLGADCRP